MAYTHPSSKTSRSNPEPLVFPISSQKGEGTIQKHAHTHTLKLARQSSHIYIDRKDNLIELLGIWECLCCPIANRWQDEIDCVCQCQCACVCVCLSTNKWKLCADGKASAQSSTICTQRLVPLCIRYTMHSSQPSKHPHFAYEQKEKKIMTSRGNSYLAT